jgi:predicted enzyme related to lactoylglutathione lyase
MGVTTVIYPVTDLGRAKATFTALLGTEPYVDQPYYVGYKAGDVEVGLDPYGHKGGAVAYNEVPDIRATLEALLEAGAQTEEDVKDVGGGKLIAIAKDADGNRLGLSQTP